jgi:putative ABC transport system permease protein
LPITGAVHAVPAPAVAVWVSEAMAQRYDLQPGSPLALPLPGRFTVAGVWRDYARQHGAAVIARDDWHRLGGDRGASDVALWLEPGADAGAALAAIEARAPALTGLQWRSAREIRAVSLRIFDRSFAVTYVLEIAAIVIGLTGIAATFSAQAIARTREFGMLRHVGVTRGQILLLLALEGLLVTALAIVLGLVAGLAIAWVLVDIVNPQSFHWTMDFRLPLGLVLGLIAALLGAAAATATIAGRRAVSGEAVLAVREDW